jgi:putative membrane protein
MMLLGPLFVVAVVAALAYALGWVRPPDSWTSHNDGGKSALDILKERYARGEITKGEYDEMRHILTS